VKIHVFVEVFRSNGFSNCVDKLCAYEMFDVVDGFHQLAGYAGQIQREQQQRGFVRGECGK
jgi:hypothetical protein